MGKVSLKINVYGTVQGIGFRFETQAVARRMGIKGFVRNEADGSVYIEAEGPREKLQRFLEWCKIGPVGARIEKVVFEWGKKTDGAGGFEVR